MICVWECHEARNKMWLVCEMCIRWRSATERRRRRKGWIIARVKSEWLINCQINKCESVKSVSWQWNEKTLKKLFISSNKSSSDDFQSPKVFGFTGSTWTLRGKANQMMLARESNKTESFFSHAKRKEEESKSIDIRCAVMRVFYSEKMTASSDAKKMESLKGDLGRARVRGGERESIAKWQNKWAMAVNREQSNLKGAAREIGSMFIWCFFSLRHMMRVAGHHLPSTMYKESDSNRFTSLVSLFSRRAGGGGGSNEGEMKAWEDNEWPVISVQAARLMLAIWVSAWKNIVSDKRISSNSLTSEWMHESHQWQVFISASIHLNNVNHCIYRLPLFLAGG